MNCRRLLMIFMMVVGNIYNVQAGKKELKSKKPVKKITRNSTLLWHRKRDTVTLQPKLFNKQNVKHKSPEEIKLLDTKTTQAPSTTPITVHQPCLLTLINSIHAAAQTAGFITTPPTFIAPQTIEDTKIPISPILCDLKTLNIHLASIKVMGGIFQIKENHATFSGSDYANIFFMKNQATPISRELVIMHCDKNIGSRTYFILPDKKTVKMDIVHVEEEFRNMKLGTLLILAALHDSEAVKHNCNRVTAITISPWARKIYQTLGFAEPRDGDFSTDNFEGIKSTKTESLAIAILQKLRARASS